MLHEFSSNTCKQDHKADYDRLQEEKKEGSDKVVGLYRRKELVHKELKQCKEAVKEANTYQSLQDELKKTKTLKALFEAFHLEKKMESNAVQAEDDAKRLKELEHECTVLNKKVTLKTKEKAEKLKDWTAHDDKVNTIKKKIREIQNKRIIKAETSIKSHTMEEKEEEKKVKDKSDKKKEVEKTLVADRRTLEVHEKDLKAAEAANKQKDIQLQGQQQSEYNRLKQQALAETKKAQREFDKTDSAQQKDQNDLNTLQNDYQKVQERIQARQDQLSKDSGDKNELVGQVQKLGNEKQRMESDLLDLDEKYKREKDHEKKLERKNRELCDQLKSAKSDEWKEKEEDKNKKTVEDLKRTYKGVHGRVSDLCKVRQKSYELPMAVVMENNLDSIVVDNNATVQKCIEFLKDHQKRPMTFLPLENITAKPPNQTHRQISSQHVKLAIDLLEFDERVEKAMWYACGDTLVTDTLAQAKELAYNRKDIRVKVVAKDGTLISKSGILTGGDPSIFDRKLRRWQANDTDKLSKEYEKNYNEWQATKSMIEKLQKDMSEKRRDKDDTDHKLKCARQNKDKTEQTFKSRNAEIGKLKAQEQEKEQKIKDLKQQIDERAIQYKREKDELQKINDTVFASFCKDLGIQNIAEYEGGSLIETRQAMQQLNELQILVEKLRREIETNNSRCQKLEKEIATAQADSKQASEKLNIAQKKLEDAKAELKQAMDEEQDLIGKRDAVQEESNAVEAEIKNYQAVLKKKTDETDEVRQQSVQSEKAVEGFKDAIKDLLENCQLDNLELPRKGQGKGKRKRSNKENEMEEEEEEEEEDEEMEDAEEGESQGQSQVVDLARQELKKLNIDFSLLTREQRSVKEKDQEKASKELTAKATAKADQLQGMNPNMKAAEQLVEINERFEVLSKEWTDARNKCDELSAEFEDVKKQRCDKFNRCFDHVMGCIDSIYKELTIDPAQGGSVGGSAYLTLNSQDEPYTSGIKYDTIPPGKRFMDMTHLSGGEKTVAALALLFAINSYSPAPFIVLDEVDAALDARNVAKVTRFIQSRREEQQCVIISLKQSFFEKADGLVGICRNAASGHSNAFTLDLSMYDDHAVA